MSDVEIVLDGLTLRPYLYEEHAEGNAGITVDARVSVDRVGRQEMESRLRPNDRETGRYFNVLWPGATETSRLMRFGRCDWSEHGDLTKYRLTLVEKSVDEARSEPFPDFYPELRNMRAEIALTSNLLTGLLDTLVEAGTLSSGQRSAVEDRANKDLWAKQWSLFKLGDIDKLT